MGKDESAGQVEPQKEEGAKKEVQEGPVGALVAVMGLVVGHAVLAGGEARAGAMGLVRWEAALVAAMVQGSEEAWVVQDIERPSQVHTGP